LAWTQKVLMRDKSRMSPEQCRAARGWLGWSQVQLAKRAKVGQSTVKDFESRRRTPIPNNRDAMRRVLEAAGIEFTNGDVPGVRMRKKR
jgi:DNA-binding transcriptional regulator YiaG